MSRSRPTPAWNNVPEDFTYPWGAYWMNRSEFKRPRGKPKYIRRKFTAFQRKMLDRITSPPPKYPEPVHPDQLYLF